MTEKCIARSSNNNCNPHARNAPDNYANSLKQSTSYPIQKEYELSSSIMCGDQKYAETLLNDILGHIFSHSQDLDTMQTRIIELLTIMSRATITGGANADKVLTINHHFIQELQKFQTEENISHWLATALRHFTDLTFNLVDCKYKNIICKSIKYIRDNYSDNLSLEEVANYVGYSPSHFSKIFNQELGCSFRTYLNGVRVEKSKSLLFSSTHTLLQISEECGFHDLSYFTKVFRNAVGVTPDRYRKQMHEPSLYHPNYS